MKFLFLCLLVYGCSLNALDRQNVFSDSMFLNPFFASAIIEEAKNGFKNITGGRIPKSKSHINNGSKVIVSGIADNDILLFYRRNNQYIEASYTASVAENLSEGKSKALLKEWKNRLHRALENEQSVRRNYSKPKNGMKSYSLETDTLDCMIYTAKPADKYEWFVGITIAKRN